MTNPPPDRPPPATGPQVEPQHYASAAYDSKERFIGYWQQVDQVVGVGATDVLEVGIGNGFLSRYLRGAGLPVHTVDFDGRLGPDTVASVDALPFPDGAFDTVCCFETLEHLPFDRFAGAARELARVARRHVLVSLPDVTPCNWIRIDWGFRNTKIDKFYDRGGGKAHEHRFDGEHYWELGKAGYPVERIVRELAAAGLELEAMSRLADNPYHRFFRTRKASVAAAHESSPR